MHTKAHLESNKALDPLIWNIGDSSSHNFQSHFFENINQNSRFAFKHNNKKNIKYKWISIKIKAKKIACRLLLTELYFYKELNRKNLD